MKRYFLLGLTALGLVALTPTGSKADDGFRIYVNPGYQQVRPYYYGDDRYRYYRYADEYRFVSRGPASGSEYPPYQAIFPMVALGR